MDVNNRSCNYILFLQKKEKGIYAVDSPITLARAEIFRQKN